MYRKDSARVQHTHTKVHISACSVQSSIISVQESRDFTVYLKPFWKKSLCSALPPGSTASFPFCANKVLIWMDGWIECKGGWVREEEMEIKRQTETKRVNGYISSFFYPFDLYFSHSYVFFECMSESMRKCMQDISHCSNAKMQWRLGME